VAGTTPCLQPANRCSYTLLPIDVSELIEVAEGCACQAARRRARELSRAYDDALRPSGLRITQLSVLVAATLMQRPTLTALADRLGLERTTLTRDLRPLESRGLLAVHVGEDRRQREIEMTEDGRAALAAALPLWREVQARTVRTR
jgi:DNA-binding MarR family transcriptional regulator